MARIVAFGEIMLRLAPPGVSRLRQSLPGSLSATFAGAEANTAVSLALLGLPVDFVTALPKGALAESCVGNLNSTGVGTKWVRQTDTGRFGLFYVETGASQRSTEVTYDRDSSAISLAGPGDFDWEKILAGVDWLHLTGITPAISAAAADLTLEAAQAAVALDVSVSFDVNFRSRLWNWDPKRSPPQLAQDTLRKLMPCVSLMIGSEGDCRLLDVELPELQSLSVLERATEVARAFHRQWPRIRYFASSLREQISASHNNWSGVLYDSAADTSMFAPVRDGARRPWEIRQIVDRVGSGDAFDAGLLFGLSERPGDLQYAIDFATAAGCLAHTISGDWNYVTRSEIETLMDGTGSGRVIR
ncbi:MAG: PfkB family carbohydrate kinase [Planctomycetaceae bacterium]